jgi:hypothetical protein
MRSEATLANFSALPIGQSISEYPLLGPHHPVGSTATGALRRQGWREGDGRSQSQQEAG